MAEEFENRYFQAHEQCQSNPETCMDEKEFRCIKRRENGVLTANFTRHAACMFKRLGFLSDEGQLQKDTMGQVIAWNYKDPKKVMAILNECYSNKATKEETSLGVFHCFRKNGVRLTNIEQK
ncbi:uncharacterized protein LOC143200569 isoform X2 [Rhynchophorus ferrugineus]|uniref:Uncharacterized protein n=1 Tax=Rhynchophorus ferrugineus TaxID=354439 RepID=A0A834I540_RHYFE|nr:hypothetical protein GWI33_014815 [Rhynchophorus ferrugineus]